MSLQLHSLPPQRVFACAVDHESTIRIPSEQHGLTGDVLYAFYVHDAQRHLSVLWTPAAMTYGREADGTLVFQLRDSQGLPVAFTGMLVLRGISSEAP